MILFVFKLAITAFVISFLALGANKALEPESKWEVQSEQVLKIRKTVDKIFFYSFIAGITLGVIWLLLIVWFI